MLIWVNFAVGTWDREYSFLSVDLARSWDFDVREVRRGLAVLREEYDQAVGPSG